jgi:hypothetical protein
MTIIHLAVYKTFELHQQRLYCKHERLSDKSVSS